MWRHVCLEAGGAGGDSPGYSGFVLGMAIPLVWP